MVSPITIPPINAGYEPEMNQLGENVPEREGIRSWTGMKMERYAQGKEFIRTTLAQPLPGEHPSDLSKT